MNKVDNYNKKKEEVNNKKKGVFLSGKITLAFASKLLASMMHQTNSSFNLAEFFDWT